MKRCLIVGIVIYGVVALVLMAGAVFGQSAAQGQNCPDGRCWVSPAKPAVAAPLQLPANAIKSTSECSKYEWEIANGGQHWLRQDGKIVGQWYEPEKAYYPWDGEKNGPACHPPIDPPHRGAQSTLTDKIRQWCENGVHSFKRNHDAPNVSLGGRKIEAHQIQDAFEGKLTDDSGKGWFVIVGQNPSIREQLEVEWTKLPADFRAKYMVWNMPPDHFSLQDRFSGKPRFATEGDPTIILQDPTGAVLFRRPRAGLKYTPADFKDLLKADPNYQPALDPGVPAAPAKPALDLSKVPTWAWVGGGVLALLVLRRKE